MVILEFITLFLRIIVFISAGYANISTSSGRSEISVSDQNLHGVNWFQQSQTTSLLSAKKDIVHGLAHLHELGIIHRDLMPQNVLIRKERPLCTKVSDISISERLSGGMTSLSKQTTGTGSSGWQVPEQLRHERQSCAVDLFNLGCVLFFCITGGRHPFGDTLERD